MLGVVLGLFGLGLGLFQLDFQIVQLGKHAVQPLVIVGHMIARGINDFFRDAELGADKERVGFARHADTEFIGGHQRLHVKFAAGIDDAGSFQRVDFQFCVVGRRHQQAALAAQPFQNADSQRCALGGVGARTQLVQQGQGSVACQIQNAADALHVAGEGGQALLDALFVADIHEVFLKVADDAALMGGNQETVLGHGVEQACGF